MKLSAASHKSEKHPQNNDDTPLLWHTALVFILYCFLQGGLTIEVASCFYIYNIPDRHTVHTIQQYTIYKSINLIIYLLICQILAFHKEREKKKHVWLRMYRPVSALHILSYIHSYCTCIRTRCTFTLFHVHLKLCIWMHEYRIVCLSCIPWEIQCSVHFLLWVK